MNEFTDAFDETPNDPPNDPPLHRASSAHIPAWIVDALRAPVPSTVDARERVLAAVRVESARVSHARAYAVRAVHNDRASARWRQRALSPFSGVLTSLMLALFVVLRVGDQVNSADAIAFTRVLGDSIVPSSALNSALNSSESSGSHWLDTLRVVEFVLRAPSVHRAAAIGAFNQWQRDAAPLHRVGRDEWRARVLVPRDALRLSATVAVLIDNVRTVPATIH